MIATRCYASKIVPGLCTFCDRPLDDSLEHILLSAIGGRKCSRRVICGHHNNEFGGTIDDVLARQLAIFCNLLAIETGRGETAATLRDLETVDGQRINLHPGGKFVGRAQFEDVEVAPNKRQIRISAGSEDQLRMLVTQYMQRYGRTHTGLENATIQRRIEPGAAIDISGNIGGEAACRAIAKMALLLLASEVGTDAVRGADIAELRAFIIDGSGTWDGIRQEYETAFERLPEHAALPEFAHRIAVVADPSSAMAIALVELFGTFRYTVLLSEAWQGPAVALHYGVDPTIGESVEARTVPCVSLTAQELRDRSSPETEVIARLGRLFALIRQRRLSLSIEEISHDVVREVLTPDRAGTTITQDDVARITQEAVGRIMAVSAGVPYQQELEAAQVFASTSVTSRGRRRRRKKK